MVVSFQRGRFQRAEKERKSTTAALARLYVIVVLGGNFAEGRVQANDLGQAAERMFDEVSDSEPGAQGGLVITLLQLSKVAWAVLVPKSPRLCGPEGPIFE